MKEEGKIREEALRMKGRAGLAWMRRPRFGEPTPATPASPDDFNSDRLAGPVRPRPPLYEAEALSLFDTHLFAGSISEGYDQGQQDDL